MRHEGVKPYVCLECPKCFYTAGELKRHALKHSNLKLFCCGLCAKDFKRKRYRMFLCISRDVPLDWDLLVGDLYISCIYLC